MNSLTDKYNIKWHELLLCKIVRKIKKSGKCPGIICKISKKNYGYKDNLARFYIEKYSNVKIGRYSYGYRDVKLNQFIKSIGSFSSIAAGVACVAGNHNMEFVTTSPILTMAEMGGFINSASLDPRQMEHSIEIGHDVWIGSGALLFPGIKIGDGAVVGAGSIIRKDVPPYAVVVGVDRIIHYRFKRDIIDKLLKIQWWNWDDDKIRANAELMKNVEAFVRRHGGELEEENNQYHNRDI